MPLETGYGKISPRLKSFLPLLEESLKWHDKGNPAPVDRLVWKIFLPLPLGNRKDREPRGAPQIRSMVLHLRLKGVPIASSHRGYWIAKTIEELQPTIDEFRLLAQRKSIVANQLAGAFQSEQQVRMDI